MARSIPMSAEELRIETVEMRAAVRTVLARLEGDPDDYESWFVIWRQLSAATRTALKISDRVNK